MSAWAVAALFAGCAAGLAFSQRRWVIGTLFAVSFVASAANAILEVV